MKYGTTLRHRKHKVLIDLIIKFVPYIQIIIDNDDNISKDIKHVTNVGAYVEFNNNKPTKIVISSSLFDNKFTLDHFKAIILHEIGHCLFITDSEENDELIAEEFAYFYAYATKDQQLLNTLIERSSLYDTNERPFKHIYKDIVKLRGKYKF